MPTLLHLRARPSVRYLPTCLLSCVPNYAHTCLLTNLLTAHLDALDRLDVVGQLLVLSDPLVLPPTEAHLVMVRVRVRVRGRVRVGVRVRVPRRTLG